MAKNENIYFDKIATKGRPRYSLNENGIKMIEGLAQINCTDEEIATLMDVSIETLQSKENLETFLEYKKRGQNKFKSTIRRKQVEAMNKGNVTMLIWLGKQYLGQREKIEASVGTDDEKLKEMQNFLKAVKGEKDE